MADEAKEIIIRAEHHFLPEGEEEVLDGADCVLAVEFLLLKGNKGEGGGEYQCKGEEMQGLHVLVGYYE